MLSAISPVERTPPHGAAYDASAGTVAPSGRPGAPLLQVEGVSKSYGNHRVLDAIELDVHPGNVVAIIGPSGSGKSTLLRCINHLEPPDTGSVRLGGLRIAAGTPPGNKDLVALRRSLGMVFQSFNLFPHMTVLRNVSLPQQRVAGRTRREADERSMALLSRVGLADKAASYPHRCSGGQQQRIAIARALALDPKMMLFDEPTSSLDPELGLEVLTVMRKLADDGMTMIVVTHEMHFAKSVCDTLVVMADGRIIERGAGAEVMSNPKEERTRRFLRAVQDR